MTTGAGDVIRLVGGDERPTIVLTLIDENTGQPIADLGSGTTTVSVKLRRAGETTVLATIPATIVSPSSGTVSFGFTGGVLDIPAGAYGFEVIVDFNGEKHTVYNILRMRLREPFS